MYFTNTLLVDACLFVALLLLRLLLLCTFRYTEADMDWDTIWCERDWMFKFYDHVHLESWQRVNHYRNQRELCRKDLMCVAVAGTLFFHTDIDTMLPEQFLVVNVVVQRCQVSKYCEAPAQARKREKTRRGS